MRKFIKTKRPARNPLIIDFKDEIIQMYVMPKGVEKGVKKQGRRYFRRSFKKAAERKPNFFHHVVVETKCKLSHLYPL